MTAIRVFGSLIFALIGVWLSYHFYVVPFLSTEGVISAEPYYIVTALLGGSIGVLVSLPILWVLTFIERIDNVKRTLLFFVVVFSGLATISNLSIYMFVIEPSKLTLCPAKIGYKKDLFRDYVDNIQKCQKF